MSAPVEVFDRLAAQRGPVSELTLAVDRVERLVELMRRDAGVEPKRPTALTLIQGGKS